MNVRPTAGFTTFGGINAISDGNRRGAPGFGTVTSASAADMPLKAPAPAYVPPAYNWTGFYLGLNVGGGLTSGGGFGDASGIIGGGQIGYNWQSVGSPFVIGLEADIQGADLSNSATALGVTVDGRLNAFGTVRGRLGYAWDRFMIYATGGWAVTRTQLDATNGLMCPTTTGVPVGQPAAASNGDLQTGGARLDSFRQHRRYRHDVGRHSGWRQFRL